MKNVIEFIKSNRDHLYSMTKELNEDPTKNKALMCKGVDIPKAIKDQLDAIVEAETKDLNIATWIGLNIFVDKTDAFHGILNYRTNKTAGGHQQHRFSGVLNISDSELTTIKSKEKQL